MLRTGKINHLSGQEHDPDFCNFILFYDWNECGLEAGFESAKGDLR